MIGARWPARPSADARCEATVGWAPDFLGQPRIRRCGEPAVETVLASQTLRVPTYVCAEHVRLGYRNPRRRGRS